MTGASYTPTVGRLSWQGGARLDLTVGLEDDRELSAAVEAMTSAVADAGGGATVTYAAGVWQGGRESSAVVSIIGDAPRELWQAAAPAALAAWRSGCEAIQAELWHGGEYWCGEWRAS